MDAAAKLDRLREKIRDTGVDLYWVPSSDAHQSEYLPDRWQRRAWLSGFTGSAGEAIVSADGAWLWTDSRYHLQAERQLDSGHWELMRSGTSGVPEIDAWLESHNPAPRLGVDPRLISLARARALRAKLEKWGGALIALETNFIDAIWQDAPPLSITPAHQLDVAFAGRSAAEKIGQIRAELVGHDCANLLLTTLDSIAWTLNLRGRDIDFNPLLISYLVVGIDQACLYADSEKLDAKLAQGLLDAGVSCAPYGTFADGLSQLKGPVWVQPSTASWWVGAQLEDVGIVLREAATPVELAKARKNSTELAGMQAAHERDGAALIRFLHWLENAWEQGLDEWSAAQRLEEFRSAGEYYQGLSFPTISGFAGNGAVVHYGVSKGNAAKIDDSALYLVDSGAQYLDGTTDVTRTVHLGKPEPEERRHYTLVLKGHLALSAAIFPQGTNGAQLDVLARDPLWREGLDYGHGTGHGVGHYLNVHEGPQSISPRGAGVALEPGMVVSNEPGLYLAGRYGIRIENLVFVSKRRGAEATGSVDFLGFEDLTLAPYCRRLIDTNLLDTHERAAVDRYHARVWARLSGRLDGGARDWLQRETQALA